MIFKWIMWFRFTGFANTVHTRRDALRNEPVEKLLKDHKQEKGYSESETRPQKAEHQATLVVDTKCTES